MAMDTHPFDQAIDLQPRSEGVWQASTHPAYANMVGPFGGITAAQALQAVLLHPQRLGEPISLTVNFCAAVADGAFEVHARPARTNRSTQHWLIELRQADATVMTATAVTALRRETWGVDEEPMPHCPPPEDCLPPAVHAPLPFTRAFEYRPVTGHWPGVWDGSGDTSLSQIWVRDLPARALDFASLACISDIFFPRLFIRRATLVPVGTVSMTVYFHAGSAQLQRTGDGYLLGQARAQAFRNGFFDQSSQLWDRRGVLLVTTHQIVYYKQ
jgi:acyl-CoA thioesterase